MISCPSFCLIFENQSPICLSFDNDSSETRDSLSFTLADLLIFLSIKTSVSIREKYRDVKYEKQYDKFLDICNRLDSTVDLSNDYCSNCKDVFSLVEKYNVDVSDIVPKDKYEKYKKYMINYPTRLIPTMGKRPDRVYDLSNSDDYKEYVRKLRGMN